MKKYILAAVTLAVTSCASLQQTNQSATMVAVKDNPDTYAYDGLTDVGSVVGTFPVRKDEKIRAITSLKYADATLPLWYVAQDPSNGKKVCLKSEDVVPEKFWMLMQIKTVFSLPRTQEAEVWSRANYYISNNGTMKIQTATDFFIQTYNPTDLYGVGFKVTKMVKGDSCEYEVAGIGYYSEADAKRCAYYMQTGKKFE